MSTSNQVFSSLIDKHIKDKPEFLKPTSISLFCQACEQNIHLRATSVKHNISSHEKSNKHQRQLSIWRRRRTNQQLMQVGLTREDKFKKNLTEMLVKCNIPFHKVSNRHFQNFIANECGKITPDESTLRKSYLKPLYEESLAELRIAIGASWIYLQVDESTDSLNRPVVSIIVGKLDGTKPRSFLLDIKYLESAPNSAQICQAINDALQVLWPGKIFYERVRLLVSDQVSYMLLAGKLLKSGLYTNMLHVSCLAHALHRVAEFAREKFPGVNRVVSSFKKVFIKCQRRRSILKESLQMSIPKFPVVTRWGTWLYFVDFLAKNLDEIEIALAEMQSEESEALESLNESLAQPNLRQDLEDLSILLPIATTITELEKRGLSIDEVKAKIEHLAETIPEDYRLKLKKSIDKNPSLQEVYNMVERERVV